MVLQSPQTGVDQRQLVVDETDVEGGVVNDQLGAFEEGDQVGDYLGK